MPELTVTVRVAMPKQPSLGPLERVIFRALQTAGRELLVQAFAILEEQVLTGARQRRRRRYLITGREALPRAPGRRSHLVRKGRNRTPDVDSIPGRGRRPRAVDLVAIDRRWALR